LALSELLHPFLQFLALFHPGNHQLVPLDLIPFGASVSLALILAAGEFGGSSQAVEKSAQPFVGFGGAGLCFFMPPLGLAFFQLLPFAPVLRLQDEVFCIQRFAGPSWVGFYLLNIQPGKPQQNAYVERNNRTVRTEWLG
jgi:hypothetical protein